jgi:RNA polymerase sigma-70 factor, ECF subfamily
MMMHPRAELEQRIREAHEAGEQERAATLALETYGREILTFLIARLGDQQGFDVFSDFQEDLWRGLPAFEWRSSLRTWAYTLAHRALIRHVHGSRRRSSLVPNAAMSAVAELVRTETAAYRKTEVKNRFRELRALLPDADQNILILRIDRKLPWRDLAVVMAAPGTSLDEAELETECARLRKQFIRAKDRLRKLAQAEGLLPEPEEDD